VRSIRSAGLRVSCVATGAALALPIGRILRHSTALFGVVSRCRCRHAFAISWIVVLTVRDCAANPNMASVSSRVTTSRCSCRVVAVCSAAHATPIATEIRSVMLTSTRTVLASCARARRRAPAERPASPGLRVVLTSPDVSSLPPCGEPNYVAVQVL